MSVQIIAINLGGTTTKVGYTVDNEFQFKETLEHSVAELSPFSSVFQQKKFRLKEILKLLDRKRINISNLSAVVTRAGVLPPIEAGGYEINETMVDYNTNYQAIEHVSNLGTSIANDLAKLAGENAKAYIYDGETLDQLTELARITGTKKIPKQSIGHLLNMRAVARVAAEKIEKKVEECHFVIAHMGGGTSVCGLANNRIVDVLADDEGPFSVERAGSVALKHVINLCYELPQNEVMRILRREGGLYSYLGTNDGRQVEGRIAQGDEHARLVYEALAYQVSKACGEMAVAVKGDLDGIILTGGLANSAMICSWIKKWAGFLAPIIQIPGEYELEALASGAYRVYTGEEMAKLFTIDKNL